MDFLPCPDLKLIKIFVTIVKNKGFAKAQVDLNLSTSAISTYMSQLEAFVGMKLCDRGRAGFSLTDKGEMYYQACLRLLNELDNFGHHISQIKGELTGTLKIGIIDSVVTDRDFCLDEMIREFSILHPNVYIHLQIQSPYELQVGILENRFDIAIGSFVGKMNGIIYNNLHEEQHWLYCSEQHPLFTEKNVTEHAVKQANIVGRSYWGNAELAKHGFKRSSTNVDSMEAQLILILSGIYIGFLPEHYIERWEGDKNLKVILPAIFGYKAPFSVITRRGRSQDIALQTFRKIVRKYQ